VQRIKIYLPCNFEVNPITHFDRLCKLEKREDEIKKKFLKYKTKSIKMKKKIDEKRAITPRWVIKFTSKLQGR
jgi:hypothetical protein